MGEFVKSASSTVEVPRRDAFQEGVRPAAEVCCADGSPLARGARQAGRRRLPRSRPHARRPPPRPLPAAPAAPVPPRPKPAAAPERRPGPRPGPKTSQLPRLRPPRSPLPPIPVAPPVAPPAEPEAPQALRGPAAPRDQREGPRASPVGRPWGAPRPGNNPFAPSQGMGRRRSRRRPTVVAPVPLRCAPDPGSGQARQPRPPAAREGGVRTPAMPRPRTRRRCPSPERLRWWPQWPRRWSRRSPVAVLPAVAPPVVPVLRAVVARPVPVPVLPVARVPAGSDPPVARPVVAVPARRGHPGCLRPGRPVAPREGNEGPSSTFEQMQAPTIGGVRVRKGDGETARLARRVADGLRREDQRGPTRQPWCRCSSRSAWSPRPSR